MKHNPRVRPTPNHLKPETWLRRGEVAKLLNRTKDAVRYLETNGALHPIEDEHGERRFDPDEVYAYAMQHPHAPKQKTDEELTATAFKMFEENRTRREVVMALRITTARADALWEEWSTEDFETAATKRREAEAAARKAAEEMEQKRTGEERRKMAYGMLKAAGINVKK
jgi:DNA-binding transcriptional MerR regulator